MKKPIVWHHSCTLHGEGTNPDGTVMPCNPPCEEPWQVDVPTDYWDKSGDVFATLGEAVDWAIDRYDDELQWRRS